jgi:hypothetical protein
MQPWEMAQVCVLQDCLHAPGCEFHVGGCAHYTVTDPKACQAQTCAPSPLQQYGGARAARRYSASVTPWVSDSAKVASPSAMSGLSNSLLRDHRQHITHVEVFC